MGEEIAAALPPIEALKTRRDFLRVAKGAKAVMPLVIVQMQANPDGEDRLRIGVTATKKLGSAVIRNRVKRRLRAAARLVAPREARAGHDYVLIGRRDTATAPFDALISDMTRAFQRVRAPRTGERRSRFQTREQADR